MKYEKVISFVCFLQLSFAIDIQIGGRNSRESRKLFGGYRITPRFCKPTRKTSEDLHGPYICMFNHECSQRNGQVVGACMDGFLFGACCQLPTGSTGELIESDIHPVTSIDNDLSHSITSTTESLSTVDIMSSGVSQIAQSLLNPGILPTAQDNAVVQINERPQFSISSITHSGPETQILNATDNSNNINADEFEPIMEDRKTTVKIEYSTVPYSEISISNGPSIYTTSSGYNRPVFRPKPSQPSDADKYVLVPTLTVPSKPNNKTQTTDQQQPVVNIYQLFNETTSRKPPSTSYVFGTTSTRRPIAETKSTSRQPPSTSYVFSTTLKPRRTTTSVTTTKRKSKPTKNSNRKPTTPNQNYFTIRPHSTLANSPIAFSTRPPSTSYVYSTTPTRRPPSTVDTHVIGPGFSVTPSTYATYSSPAPTLIVLGPVGEPEQSTQSPPNYEYYPTTRPQYSNRPTSSPSRKPINSVVVNNHVTQNIYSTSERPPLSPQPTVLITPKPSISSSMMPNIEYNTAAVEVETSGDELINFPPVRNPNLNMSNPSLNDDDDTTPTFVEDDVLNEKVESFVNKIIQGLQEPFQGLRDVVYNKNKTSASLIQSTTKKPVKKTGTTTRRPATTRPTTTRRTTTRRTTTPTTRRTTTTTKRVRTTRRPTTTTTTTESFIEHDNNDTLSGPDQYRNECGVRPLLKTGRIVGGKPATYGEFPWQVLVKESTWLGLFTKNKCGGVLISNKYVMTAAHCQPGFLASLIAVFGELDINGDLESRRPISRNVKRVIVHRKYDAATFENDLALLELDTPIHFDAHIIPICLPRDGADFTGRMATVTGWGRLKYGGGVPSVLQEVQVPIMENHVCQDMFRTAGHSKVILDSFLCAGYANGQKDSCEGDSGGPLVLQRPDGRYELAGTVSHGIKCAAPYLPGVYMRTAFYKKWIQAITGIVD